MPSAVETLLFSPDGMVTLNALKRSGRSVTVGNFVAATTVRMIGGWTGGVCAATELAMVAAPRMTNPILLIRTLASQNIQPYPAFRSRLHAGYGSPAVRAG